MYSGSDSAESQNYTQWALNPSSYQNMSNDEVDWAALAQQWIIMKEAGPPLPEQMVTAPPPPVISKQAHAGKKEDGGGEAPMDVENDEDGANQWNEGGSSDSFTWGQGGGAAAPPPPQSQPPWGWSGAWPGAPAAVPPPSASVKAPLLPTPAYNSYSSGKEPASDNASYGYNSVPPTGQNYWTASATAAAAGSSKVIKPHNKRYSKVNVPVPVKPTVATLDATKRKQLPAWIREGLEKMERDKLKQMDRSREKLERNEFDEKAKLRENAMEILKSTVKEAEVKKLSAYDDDSEESVQSPPRRSPTPLTHEEMMLKVRRTMTEILLKVTNREIQNICREELQRHVRKLKASDQRVSAPSGANLSAKLGLGVYDGSGESSAESDDESNQGYRDSDSELRDIIRRRKEDFVKTERDIEDRLAQADKNDENSRPGTPDSDSQVDAKGQERRSRRSEDATPPPPPSKNKSTRKRHSSHSTLSDSDTDKYSKSKDRRSSSSDRPKRSARRSRSRTPPTKTKAKSRGKRSRSNSRRRDGYGGGNKRRSKYSRSRSRSRSRSYRRRSRRRSDSRSPYKRSRSRSRSSRRYRRSRSYSNGRGKRSHRH